MVYYPYKASHTVLRPICFCCQTDPSCCTMSSHQHSNILICLDHLHMPLFNVDSLQQRSMGNQIYGHMKASQCTPKTTASQWNIHHLKLYFLLILAMFQSHASFQGCISFWREEIAFPIQAANHSVLRQGALPIDGRNQAITT